MCFQDAVFPLLARMRRGLYYNTYLLPGCHGSGLMQAFSKHVVSRLGVEQMKSEADRVRVTLLSRSTKHRRIVNENEVCVCVCVCVSTSVHQCGGVWCRVHIRAIVL